MSFNQIKVDSTSYLYPNVLLYEIFTTHSYSGDETIDTVNYGYANSNKLYSVYDSIPKICCFDEEDSNVDDANIYQVFLNGFNTFTTYTRYWLTDNTELMLELNDEPMHILTYSEYGYPNSDSATREVLYHPITVMPQFNRYLEVNGTIQYSWDFNTPEAMFIENPTIYQDSSTIFNQYWKSYVEDLYSVENKKVTQYVFLPRTINPTQLMRYWFRFNGGYWICTKITDYNPNSVQPTKCEFVKVQDISNYIDV